MSLHHPRRCTDHTDPGTNRATATSCAQLAGINVANEEPNRRALREMLFRADGIENYIRCLR